MPANSGGKFAPLDAIAVVIQGLLGLRQTIICGDLPFASLGASLLICQAG